MAKTVTTKYTTQTTGYIVEHQISNGDWKSHGTAEFDTFSAAHELMEKLMRLFPDVAQEGRHWRIKQIQHTETILFSTEDDE